MEIKIRFMTFSSIAAHTECMYIIIVCCWHLKERLENSLYGLDPETVTHDIWLNNQIIQVESGIV